MDSTQFSTDLIKKFQQFFRHMDKSCSEFLGVDYQPLPAQKKDQKQHKVRDPNAPKRNLSAFFFFSNLYREKILQRNPDMKIIEIARIAGNKWREMTPEERAPYQQKAEEDKARYDLEHAKYQHDHGIPEVETKKKKKQQKVRYLLSKVDDKGFKSGIEGDESESHSQIPNLLLKVQQQKEAKEAKEQKEQKQKDTKDTKEKQQKKKAQSVPHAEPEEPESPIIVQKGQATKTIKQKGASTTQNQKKFSADQDDIQADIDKFMKNKESPQRMTIPVKKVKKQ